MPNDWWLFFTCVAKLDSPVPLGCTLWYCIPDLEFPKQDEINNNPWNWRLWIWAILTQEAGVSSSGKTYKNSAPYLYFPLVHGILGMGSLHLWSCIQSLQSTTSLKLLYCYFRKHKTFFLSQDIYVLIVGVQL